MIAQAAADGGLTLSLLLKILGVILAICVVVGIVVGLSLVFWRILIWVFFGGRKRGVLSATALAGGLYLDLINPLDLSRSVDRAWGQNPAVALLGIFVLAGPIYVIYSLFSTGSVPSVPGGGWGGGGPSSGGWSNGHLVGSAPSGQPNGGVTRPPFDSRYGPQQGTWTPADQRGGLYSDGPGQGFNTLADEPGGLYSDGPRY